VCDKKAAYNYTRQITDTRNLHDCKGTTQHAKAGEILSTAAQLYKKYA